VTEARSPSGASSIPVLLVGEKPSRQVIIENAAGDVVYRCFAPTPQAAQAMFEEWALKQTPEEVPEGQYRLRLAHPSKPKPDGGLIHA
jgi:hypothetical protein